MTRTCVCLVVVWLMGVAGAQAQAARDGRSLGIKYVRDSEEYAAISRQTYRLAAEAVRAAAGRSAGKPWAVVLDIDETALDNSAYQLEREAYRLPFDGSSWNAWVLRHAAETVPGVVEFISGVRQAGGHVAWISNRDTATDNATRLNLQTAGLWSDADRLCLQDGPQHTKRQRRAEVVSGQGRCAWSGEAMTVVAFLGDQMGDFPEAAEQIPDTGTDIAFGRTCFLLPNSMYGQWSARVTRLR